MNNKLSKNKKTKNRSQSTPKGGILKLGLDVHVEKIVVAPLEASGAPKAAQRFTPGKFLVWVKGKREAGWEVYSCYETGPLGFGLHRELEEMGVKNLVVRARCLDHYGQRVKTDKRDARSLVSDLDRYLAGNAEALSPVRIPSEAEEQSRMLGRQREDLQRQRQSVSGTVRGTCLFHGYRLKGKWWSAKALAQWQGILPEFLWEYVQSWIGIIRAIEEQLKEIEARLVKRAPQDLPVGLGALSASLLEGEICAWERFSQGKQVASFSGLCPTEYSSGNHRVQGSINKHGNRRIRSWMIEATWRLFRFQPGYKRIQKFWPQLANRSTSRSRRKKIVVAIARHLIVDWWRIRTGRVRAEELGLVTLSQAPSGALLRIA